MKARWAWGVQIVWVLLPSLVDVGWGVIRVWRRDFSPVTWALILNGLFVVSLPPASTDYMVHSTRLELGLIAALAWAIFQTRRPQLGWLWYGLALIPLIIFRPGFYF